MKMRSSPFPSVQYATPRPDSRRGAAAARLPSSIRYIHSSSPVAASIATASRLRADRGVEHAVDHQRRRLEIEVRPDAEDIGLEPPGDLQLAEVLGVDLIVRHIASASQIAAVGAPLAALCAGLTVDDRR